VRGRSTVALGLGFAVLVTLAASLTLSLAMSLVGHAWPAANRHLAVGAMVEVVLYMALAAALMPLSEARALQWFSRPQTRVALCAAALGVVLHGPADFIEAWVQRFAPLPAGTLEMLALRLRPDTVWERVALFALLAGLIPVVEEIFFRGALFARLKGPLGAELTVLVTSLGFTVSHGEPRSWPALLSVALVLGVVRKPLASLWPCILIHATFNATTLTVVFLSSRGALVEPPEPSLLAAIPGAMASSLLLYLLLRDVRAGRPA